MQYIPDTRPYPDDFIAWIDRLKRFKRLRAEKRGGMWTFTFDSKVHMAGHKGKATHYSTFSLLPATVLDSVNWRRLVAAYIRQVRFGCRRKAYPVTVIGRKAPELPWPR